MSDPIVTVQQIKIERLEAEVEAISNDADRFLIKATLRREKIERLEAENQALRDVIAELKEGLDEHGRGLAMLYLTAQDAMKEDES